jgi:hypothetical protein
MPPRSRCQDLQVFQNTTVDSMERPQVRIVFMDSQKNAAMPYCARKAG